LGGLAAGVTGLLPVLRAKLKSGGSLSDELPRKAKSQLSSKGGEEPDL